MRLPAKLSSFGGVFRYDEPQKGRYRYFHQWDIEVYGKPGIESEAEIIEFTSRLFDSLLLKNITIDINHRNLVESYINHIFDSKDPELVGDILRAIDKIQKKSRQEIIDEFKDRYDYLKELFDSLENRGVSNVRINFGIVRGLDYYSGTVFEVFDKNSTLGALAGGGRYDSLTKAFGREDIGATGVAGGVERIILTMQEQKIISDSTQPRVSVLYINDETQKVAMSIASLLRLANIPTNIDISGKQFKKQMDQAGNSRFCVIVGPKELEQGKVVVRDMKSGEESQIDIETITDDPVSVLNLEKL
jgi:histidyl-tRNA synthetase